MRVATPPDPIMHLELSFMEAPLRVMIIDDHSDVLQALATQLAKRKTGIRVNGVAPGPIWTPLIPSAFDEDKVDEFGADVPLGRPGQPEEVAPAFVYLASEADSSYVTGQIIHVNGGEIVNA